MSEKENEFLKQMKMTLAITISSLIIIVGGSIINTHFKTRQLEKDISKKADKELVDLNNSHIFEELKEIKTDVRGLT